MVCGFSWEVRKLGWIMVLFYRLVYKNRSPVCFHLRRVGDKIRGFLSEVGSFVVFLTPIVLHFIMMKKQFN